MHICITGARGRLGFPLAQALTAAGHEVVALSRNSDARFACLGNLPAHIRRGTDVVLHLGWSSVPASAEKNPGGEWREDLPLLAAILSECAQLAGSPRRTPLFVFFSSCAVYGEPAEGRADPFTERDSTNPRGWYAAAKVAGETLVGMFARQGVRTLVLRVSNPYGFTQSANHIQGILPSVLNAAFAGRDFEVWGDGKTTKDFLHIDDLCRAVEAALDGGHTGVFNVCSGEQQSVNEVLKMIGELSGQEIKTKHAPAAPWDVQRALYSNEKFRAATGWRPLVAFRSGLSQFVRDASHCASARHA